MKILTISKKGEIFLESINELGEKKIEVCDCLSKYLLCETEFEDGLSFGTFFELLLKEKDFFNRVFYQELRDRGLEYFEEEFQKKHKKPKGEYSISVMEISKVIELLFFDGGKVFNMYPIFIGKGEVSDDFIIHIPVSAYSVSELKKVPIEINRMVEFIKNDEIDSYSKSLSDSIGDMEDEDGIVRAVVNINLYDIIQAIISEISYLPTKKEKDDVRNSLKNMELGGEKIKILEMELKESVDKDDYESASSIKKEIDKLKAAEEKKKK